MSSEVRPRGQYPVHRLISVRFKKNAGRPIINESTATAVHDLAIFRNALAYWKYFNGGKS